MVFLEEYAHRSLQKNDRMYDSSSRMNTEEPSTNKGIERGWGMKEGPAGQRGLRMRSKPTTHWDCGSYSHLVQST